MNERVSHPDQVPVSSFQCPFFAVVQLATPNFHKTVQLPATAIAIRAYATFIAARLLSFGELDKLVIGLLTISLPGYRYSG